MLFGTIILQNDNHLINSVWSHKVTDKCFDKLTFEPDNVVLEYDCELNYTFHSSYSISKDTISIQGKDDSHSEDNGKITSYWRIKYLTKNNGLYVIESKELVEGKWKNKKVHSNVNPDYLRIK
jgi:hypothetical protein